MQLNELLQEHSIKTISERTMISEDNVERMIAENFKSLSKAKALGFLSILEREYHLDVKNVKKSIVAHYDTIKDNDEIVHLTHPKVEEKKGRSKWFFFLMLFLLAYASWYFFMQFDKKTLKTLMPSFEDKSAMPIVEENQSFEISEATTENREDNTNKEAIEVETKIEEKIDSIVTSPTSVALQEDTGSIEANVMVMDIDADTHTMPSIDSATIVTTKVTKEVNVSIEENSTRETISMEENKSDEIEETVVEATKVILKPVKRLWFGLVNMRTGKRDHFSVRKPFTIDLIKGDWLVATSPAPFSLTFKDKTELYKNGREHYFIVTKKGITSLKKKAYVRKGGYRKW